MPCSSSYMEPSAREKESKNVIALLKEVGLVNYEVPYYGEVDKLDGHTAILCDFCQRADVAKYSLELQIWWRDHKKADEQRVKREVEEAEESNDREKALAKLTDYERGLLGL